MPAPYALPRTCRDCRAPIGKSKRLCDPCRQAIEIERAQRTRDARKAAGLPSRKPPTPEEGRRWREAMALRAGRVLPTREELVSRAAARATAQRAAQSAARAERAEAVLRRKAAEAARRARRDDARAERYRLKPWTRPGIGSAEKYRLRYQLDPEFSLRERLRAQVRDRRKVKRFEAGLRDALNGRASGKALAEALGYSIAALRLHFERQFTAGMSWGRFAAGEIHIGHVLPLASFDLSVEAEIRAAWALPNLRPEWAGDNIRRGSRRDLLI